MRVCVSVHLYYMSAFDRVWRRAAVMRDGEGLAGVCVLVCVCACECVWQG